MKKSVVVLFAMALIAGLLQGKRLEAFPDFKKKFDEKYTESNKDLKAAVMEAKCNVCHFGTDKKNRNDYGKALSETVKPGLKDRLKTDKEAALKEMTEALEKVESKKSSGGMTFGELLKAGKLPGTEPKK